MIDYSITDSVTAETKPTGRTYFTPGGSFPSITTLLGKTSPNLVYLERWKEKVGEEEAARVSKEATDRGTLVHEYVERYWNKEDITSIISLESIKVRQPALSIIEATSKCVTEVWAQEIPVWSSELGFAGRVDMIGLWNDIPAIIDFKTSKKEKKGKDIRDYFLQCSGYAHAHNELFNTSIKKIVVVIGVDDKKDAQIFEQTSLPFIPELRNRVSLFHRIMNEK